MEAYCICCSKKRRVRRVGSIIYGAKEYPILVCQWCRAASTKWKKKYNTALHPSGRKVNEKI